MNLQLESHALQCLAGALHNLLTGGSGSSETDLVNSWVGSEPWAEVVVSRETLDEAWWEELLCKLDKLKIAVWGEWRWLDDD